MENLIDEMINYAKECEKYEEYETSNDVIKFTKKLINILSGTYNCPSNWRCIGETLEENYKNSEDSEDEWVYEQLELWDYESE